MTYYIHTYRLAGHNKKIDGVNRLLGILEGFVIEDENLGNVTKLVNEVCKALDEAHKGRALKVGNNGPMIYIGIEKSDAQASINFYPIKGEFLGTDMSVEITKQRKEHHEN